MPQHPASSCQKSEHLGRCRGSPGPPKRHTLAGYSDRWILMPWQEYSAEVAERDFRILFPTFEGFPRKFLSFSRLRSSSEEEPRPAAS